MLEGTPSSSPHKPVPQTEKYLAGLKLQEDSLNKNIDSFLETLDGSKPLIGQLEAISKETQIPYWDLYLRITDPTLVEKAFHEYAATMSPPVKTGSAPQNPSEGAAAFLCVKIFSGGTGTSRAWLDFLKSWYPNVLNNYSGGGPSSLDLTV